MTKDLYVSAPAKQSQNSRPPQAPSQNSRNAANVGKVELDEIENGDVNQPVVLS